VTDFLLALPVLLLSVVAHEYAHGLAALTQGDQTAKAMGRLTLNPVKHLDPWLSVLMPLILWFGSGGAFVFGGAKPVPVNPANYRHGRRSDLIVSSAGIATNLVLAAACTLLAMAVGFLGMAVTMGGILAVIQRLLVFGIWLNFLLAFFNVIPIPPLDGSHILYHFLPPSMREQYRALSQYGFLILLGILLFLPQVLRILLIPAWVLFDAAAALVRPYALGPLPF